MPTRVLVFVLAIFSISAHAQCRPPAFRSADKLENEAGLLKMSVKPQSFTLNGIICLAETLKKNHPEWNDVVLMIFTSQDAAKHFIHPGVEIPSSATKWANQLHAVYMLDRTKNQESLDILPAGWNTPKSFSTEFLFQ